MSNTAFQDLSRELREVALLHSVGSLMDWDERTQLPPKGGDHRAAQASLIARLVHEKFTSPRIGELLKAAEDTNAAPDSDVAVTVRETNRSYLRATKIPASLVEEQTRVAVLAQQAWGEARAKSDYASFAPWLEKTVKLKRDEANCVGFEKDMYDALLDQFEPGETTANLRTTFENLREPLVELIRLITESGRKAPLEILERDYPADAQNAMAREGAAALGFDFEAGRLDQSLHPFCTGLGPGDTRMTTRYDIKFFGDAFFGVLHETGHCLYEQGLPAEQFGLPMGEACSLGIHESQSRLWENFVGRSDSFWKYFLPKTRQYFPQSLKGVDDHDWYFAVNDIRPSLIRTEADEATYNLHVLLRFELEQALLSGDLQVKDLPAAWAEKMQKYLGLTPPDDARGCLQDIHWSSGAIGYFPTYTLGNLYAAQFFEQASEDIPNLEEHFATGDFASLLKWLRENIHRHGKRYTAPELCKRVTGQPLTVEPLLRHLNRKAELYIGSA